MKKLFLTSGIIACMACPAFATGGFDDSDGGSAATTIQQACDYEHLKAYSGSSTLSAQWDKNWYFINLDEDQVVANTNETGAGASNATTVYDPLYSIYTDPKVYTGHSGTAQDYSDWVITNGVTYGNQDVNKVVTSVPTGKTVNYTFVDAGSSYTGTTSMPEPQGVARTFLGYYQNQNSTGTSSVTNAGNQYVDATGHLTQAGSTAASGAQDDQTWYAYYNCATPTLANGNPINDPTKVGYTFAGWGTSSTDTGEYVTLGCIDQSTTLYAHWTANNHNITFSCGNPLAGSYSRPSANPETVVVATDGEFTLAAACTMPGYTFVGWSCPGLTATPNTPATTGAENTLFGANFGGTGTRYASATDTACTAVWRQNNIGLTWTDPSGANSPTNGTCDYDGSITLPANPERNGYVFTGWDVTSINPAPQEPQEAQTPYTE